jgi:hypothetical protein
MTPRNLPLRTTYQVTNPRAAQRTVLVALGKSLWRNRRCLTQARRARLAGNCDRHGQGSHVTQVALLALVARYPAISRRTVMSNSG